MERIQTRPATTTRPNGQAELDRLEKNLRIDEHALDQACIEQPDLFYRAAKAYVLAVSKRDAAKQELAEVEARVDTKVRAQYSRGNEKVREREIEAEVILSSEVQEMKDLLANLNEKVGILAALKEAYSQRGYVIKDLASLWVAGYYSQASAGASGHNVREVRAEQAREAMAQSRREYNAHSGR